MHLHIPVILSQNKQKLTEAGQSDESVLSENTGAEPV